MNQPILLYRSGSVYANETAAWAALDAVTHKKGQPIVAFYTLSSPVSGHHGSSTIGAIFAIGIGDGVGQYKACTSHDDMLIVAQSLNAHITQFNQMFEYDATNNAIKAKLDFYTTDGKSISAGGIGSGSSASLGALYQLVDVMANSSNTGVEGAVEGSVLAYDATAGKWKAIAQSEILPDMSGYYTKDETDSAINTAKSNLQGQIDTLHTLIPATATADNQLADKDFVNSSIATATAEFKGSFTSLDELKATSGNLNDYAFYLHTDSVGNSIVDRYKWTTAGWLYEYTLNNSSFTAEQWAALNSAITATLVQSYNSHLKNSTIHITANERTAWNAKWDYDEETIKGVKVNAAVSADKLTTDAGTSAIPIYFENGKPARCIPSDLFSGFDNGYSSTERFLGITIAGHTRTVVVAYSTLAGSADKLATPRTLWGRPFDGSANVDGDLKDVGNITASGKATIQGDIVCGGEVAAIVGEGTPAGVTDYSALTGKPQINGVTLVSGNNTLASLGIQAAGDYATNSGVTTLLADYATKTFVSNNYAGKAAFNSHIADTDIHITASERTVWNAKWDYNEATIKAVKVTSASSADSVAWSGISDKPTSLKNPYALTFGSKTYDGSAAATITASDLGALTAHQTIYALTLQVNSVSQGTYNPASAAKTINIAVPTKTSEITNDSGFITSASIPTALKNPYAVEIKANGVSLGTYDGSAAATFNLSAANVGAASKVHSHTASEISGLPTALSAFNNDVGYITGITKSMVEGVLTGDITSHTHTFASLISKPTTIAGFGITDALTTSNYNSYAPTLTGTGASGTWGISISGNAANATALTSNAGDSFNPVYFSEGKPVACTMSTGSGYGIVRSFMPGTYTSANQFLGNGTIVTIDPLGTGCISHNDTILSLGFHPTRNTQLLVAYDRDGVYYRRIINDLNYGDWKKLAFTDSDITGNAASATKLQTPRTIWGQSFDGTGNVNGDINITNGALRIDNKALIYVSSGISILGNYNQNTYLRGFNLAFHYGASATTGMLLNSSGNILIGTTTDNGYKLQVNGSERVYGNLIVDGEVSALVA